MILAVDVGNTHVVFGGFSDSSLRFVSRLSTNLTQTEDEYSILINSMLCSYEVVASSVEGVLISSVVPKLTRTLKKALERLVRGKVWVLTHEMDLGFRIATDYPAGLGADFLCASAGVIKEYPLPAIVIDLGTATKIFAIDENKTFLGTSILPGVQISLDALSNRTAQLPHISLSTDTPLIGTNTVDAMRSGVLYGTASMIEGLVARYQALVGQNATLIATGGIAPAILPSSKVPMILDENLLLKGLKSLYDRNCAEIEE